MHLLVKLYRCFLQLMSSEPDHLLAVYLSPLLRSADLLAGINDEVGRTPFQFLKLPYKLLSFLQRKLTNDILLLHRSCESVQAKIYCAADPTISYNIKMADKYQYHGKIGFLWFDIFLKSIINP